MYCIGFYFGSEFCYLCRVRLWNMRVRSAALTGEIRCGYHRDSDRMSKSMILMLGLFALYKSAARQILVAECLLGESSRLPHYVYQF